MFSEAHTVRWIVDEQGITWWIAQDVGAILELANISDSLSTVPDDEKGIATLDTLGGPQKLLTVNEPGLYRLIFRSRKLAARRFKWWVLHEVLPQIRRTGTYTMPGQTLTLPPRPARRIEISLHMAKAWRLLRTSDEWLSNQEIAQRTGIAPRTARSYTYYLGHYGLLECQEVFPRHLYRLAQEAERQCARLWQHLDGCTAILLSRIAY
jgi:prophage antirepressor-like protein